jgi:four helix bundle protein
VRIARGSLRELETHLLLAQRLSLADYDQIDAMLADADEIGRMLHALINRLQQAPARP